MHPAIPHLIDLQKLDQLIAALRADLESLPKRMREADAQLNGARAAVVSSKEGLTHSITERKKFELDVNQWRDRAKKYREQSSAVKTNEAYKALQHEIANAEKEVSQAEDLVLEQMMGAEEAERRIKHFEADLKEAEQAVAKEKNRSKCSTASRRRTWKQTWPKGKRSQKKFLNSFWNCIRGSRGGTPARLWRKCATISAGPAACACCRIPFSC
jgi:predicted  nucleic acid-binding Zn-ribbon protein